MSEAAQCPEAAHYVYMVRCKNGALYTGYARNVEQRVTLHNAGRGGRYTRAHRPVELMASWRCGTKREALQLEYRIKQLPRDKKLKLIQGEEVPEGVVQGFAKPPR